MYRLFSAAHYDFIGLRRKAYVVSAVALTLGLVFALFSQATRGSWARYGVDFTGGSIVQVIVPQARDAGDLRGVVNQVVSGSEITKFGDREGEYLIRTPGTAQDAATTGSDAVIQALRARFGDQLEVVRTEAVGAKVGSELQTRALLAILISFVATLIYLAFRFEWRFGLAAVIATAHDILLTLGLIAVLRLEVSLTMVAAVLTIVGYSLNDTIVIFDRIRENLKASRRADFIDTLNRSINDTLPRTILTSGTTLAVLTALFVFGGAITREFALVLIIGIVLGTYSSIFVAAPALLEIEKRWPGEAVKPKRTRAPVRA
ncbi:MAG TPA: protein translocase subunit SecF [Longimicrobiales bacterium]|nr:protein translocase subunit SecF [Longimicrobiales bacterium]